MKTLGIASGDFRSCQDDPVGTTPSWGGSGWARVGQYIPYLEEEYNVVYGTLYSNKGFLGVECDITKELHTPDILITQRLMNDGISNDCRHSVNAGMIVIQDIDDWYWALDHRNAAWKGSHPKHNKARNTDHYARSIEASSMIVASTPWIADRSASMFSLPTEVIPNYVDIDRFTRVEQDVATPKLGWVGSTAHRSGDLELMKGILRQFTDDYQMYHGGDNPQNPQADTFAHRVGLPEDAVEKAELCLPEEYPGLLDMQLGIIPLRDVPFNHAKSDIKGLEYAACGIPFVSSYSPSYEALRTSWGGSFDIAYKPKDWVRAIKKYTDLSYRQEKSDEVFDRVKSRDIRRGADLWLELLSSL